MDGTVLQSYSYYVRRVGAYPRRSWRALSEDTTNVHRPPGPAGNACASQPHTCGLVFEGQGPKAPQRAWFSTSGGSDRIGADRHVLRSNNHTNLSIARLKAVWPSGLRRWRKAPFRKGVGSNPTAVSRFRAARTRWSCCGEGWPLAVAALQRVLHRPAADRHRHHLPTGLSRARLRSRGARVAWD